MANRAAARRSPISFRAPFTLARELPFAVGDGLGVELHFMDSPCRERAANAPGEIPGLSALIPGVLFRFVPFLPERVSRDTGRKPLFHGHFRALGAGLQISKRCSPDCAALSLLIAIGRPNHRSSDASQLP